MKRNRLFSSVLALTLLIQTGLAVMPSATAADGSVSLGASTLSVGSDSAGRAVSATAQCPAGYVVVSIGYQDSHRGDSDIVNAVRIVCAKLESNGTLGARTGYMYAGATGTRAFYDINCPQNYVAYGAYTKDYPVNSENSDRMDGIGAACRAISVSGLGALQSYQGNSDIDGSPRERSGFQCAGNSVVTGIVERDFGEAYAANPTATDSFDLYCAPVIVQGATGGGGGGGVGAAQCNDGIDNDGDGLVDFRKLDANGYPIPGAGAAPAPSDPGCSSATDNDETTAQPPACQSAQGPYGPLPYLSQSYSIFRCDRPNMQYFHLEDFEDHQLNTPGVSLSIPGATHAGSATSYNHTPSIIDSVDGDDGVIDGRGNTGTDSYWYCPSTSDATFTFNAQTLGGLPTHVGLVWTDGVSPNDPAVANAANAQITFRAYDAQGNLVATAGPAGGFADNTVYNTTGEDRFFGAISTQGIARMVLSSSAQGKCIEIDHVQYGRFPTQSTPQCRDGIDNDGDGKTDYPHDPGCTNPDDNDEDNPPVSQCADGIDNADPEDTLFDYNDPGCYTNGIYNPNDNDETNQQPVPQCRDGVDNADPEDTLFDYNDPGCYTNGIYNPNDNDETNQQHTSQCSDGIDNDWDGKIDTQDPGCYTNGIYNPNDNDETDTVQKPQCSDGKDNDWDGKVDVHDPGCYTNGIYNPNDNDETNQQHTSQCSDGIDNDWDGKVDYPHDSGCDSANDNDETNSSPYPCSWCSSSSSSSYSSYSSSSHYGSSSSSSYNHGNKWMWNWAKKQKWHWGN